MLEAFGIALVTNQRVQSSEFFFQDENFQMGDRALHSADCMSIVSRAEEQNNLNHRD